ncbi:LCP family protein [Arthrobacter sp. JSM 101049]|uniref:LCP family protein n=1 Tax=Arthrobacter sp. JSM 101049 TaxID=929097 RepID=UPI003567FA6D
MTLSSRTAAAVLAPVMTLALLTGCSKPAEPAPSPAPSTPASSSAAPKPAVETSGLSKQLTAFATKLYTGKTVPTSGPATAALKKAEKPKDTPKVTGTAGTWNKEDFAVLTSGKDVTLVVKKKGEWMAVGGWWPSLGIKDAALGGKRHVLIMGSDARERQGQKVAGQRADGLQVIGVDGEGGGGVMGIPRDLWVTQPGGGKAKINNAMATHGPEAEAKLVANVTDLDIEGYVLTGFTGFQKMIDELGGITVDAPMKVRDVPKGKHHVDGYDAFWFSRERKTLPNGDFDRSFNQGLTLAGIAGATIADGPQGLATVLDTANKYVQTDLTAEQALTLGAWAYQVDLKKMGHQVPEAAYGWSADRQSILRITDATESVFKDFKDGNLSR